MKTKWNFWILASVILLSLSNVIGPVRAAAQVPTTTVNGIVTDPHGATVYGAKVSASNRATGVVRETTSNSDGLYAIPDLPAGNYDVSIVAAGFATREFAGVALEPGRATTLDAQLELASVSSTVNVTDAGQTVELTESMIQGQITSTTIETLPLNGRNFLELAYLIPGNRPAPNFDPTKTNTLEVSSAGGFGRGGNINVDGGDNNDEVVGGTLANFRSPPRALPPRLAARETASSISSPNPAPTTITARRFCLSAIATCRPARPRWILPAPRRLLIASNTAAPSAARL